jgi:hypothetical protein
MIQVGATVLLQFQESSPDDFFLNPFYIIGMVNGIFFIFMVLRYSCKTCHKHQLYSQRLRLPREKCWNCGNDTDHS